MKALFFVALLALVAVSSAAIGDFAAAYPANHKFCTKDGFKKVDVSSYYYANATVTKVICVLNYYSVCYTVSGAVPCNTATSKCVDVGGEWDNKALSPVSASRMTERPQVCIAEGAYHHAEYAALALAQPVVSWVVLILCTVLLFGAVKKAGAGIADYLCIAMLFIKISFLIFSFWYLNAFLGFMAIATALGLRHSKDKKAIIVGMIALLAALLWFTYAGGLGYAQHQARFDVPMATRYEEMCNNFYRGRFGHPIALHGAFESPAVTTKNYCQREVLGVMLFFVIYFELSFLVLLAVCAFKVGHGEEKQEEKVEEVKEERHEEPAPAPAAAVAEPEPEPAHHQEAAPAEEAPKEEHHEEHKEEAKEEEPKAEEEKKDE